LSSKGQLQVNPLEPTFIFYPIWSWLEHDIKTIKQEQAFGLNMITFPSHTPYVFQPLNIFCFKPFKTTIGEEKDEATMINYCLEPNKVMLPSWVDHALEQALFNKKHIIKV
jgi:hypothetical protein